MHLLAFKNFPVLYLGLELTIHNIQSQNRFVRHTL
jgi:hypothetical protein